MRDCRWRRTCGEGGLVRFCQRNDNRSRCLQIIRVRGLRRGDRATAGACLCCQCGADNGAIGAVRRIRYHPRAITAGGAKRAGGKVRDCRWRRKRVEGRLGEFRDRDAERLRRCRSHQIGGPDRTGIVAACSRRPGQCPCRAIEGKAGR